MRERHEKANCSKELAFASAILKVALIDVADFSEHRAALNCMSLNVSHCFFD